MPTTSSISISSLSNSAWFHASSFGTGELIRRGLDLNASEIILAIGGSATVDGAAGILRALGVRFLDSSGNDLTNLPEALVDLGSINLSDKVRIAITNDDSFVRGAESDGFVIEQRS